MSQSLVEYGDQVTLADKLFDPSSPCARHAQQRMQTTNNVYAMPSVAMIAKLRDLASIPNWHEHPKICNEILSSLSASLDVMWISFLPLFRSFSMLLVFETLCVCCNGVVAFPLNPYLNIGMIRQRFDICIPNPSRGEQASKILLKSYWFYRIVCEKCTALQALQKNK